MKSGKRANRDRLEEWMRTLNNQRAAESDLRFFSLSPKCIALLHILHNELRRVGHREFKTLVLVQRRKVAEMVSVLINQSPLPIVSDFLISSVSKGGAMNAKMTSSQQRDHLSRFHITDSSDEDRIDVLVATSLLEEGLDIPSCKLVVKFNDTLSSKQDVQCKGRARHRNSRYIHIIHENDEERATRRLKRYKEFQTEILRNGTSESKECKESKESMESTNCSISHISNLSNSSDSGDSVLNPRTFGRGLFVEISGAFLVEKNAYNKLHEIYNRFDRNLNCNVPWESFAVSPFSKHNFEQSVYSGICGLWKVHLDHAAKQKKVADSMRDQYRWRVRRVRDSDDKMEGTLYITNMEYEAALEQFRSDLREQRRDRSESAQRAQSPPIPSVLAMGHLQYHSVNVVNVEWLESAGTSSLDNEVGKVSGRWSGEIAKDRNSIAFSLENGMRMMTMSRISNVSMANQDPNAFACTC